MGHIKQHNMIKLKRGEDHPIFNREYLPENIASLVETVVLLTEFSLMLLFLSNAVVLYFHKYTADLMLAAVLNAGTANFLSFFHAKSNITSNIVALVFVGIAYYFTREYFEFVKYNLHPKKKRAHKAAIADTVEGADQIT